MRLTRQMEGRYIWHGVLVWHGTNPLNPDNWLSNLAVTEFEFKH